MPRQILCYGTISVISVASVLKVAAVTSWTWLLTSAAVLIVSWKPFEGAVATLRRLREAGLPLALVTNTVSRTRASIAAALSGAGFALLPLTFDRSGHRGRLSGRALSGCPVPAAQQRG